MRLSKLVSALLGVVLDDLLFLKLLVLLTEELSWTPSMEEIIELFSLLSLLSSGSSEEDSMGERVFWNGFFGFTTFYFNKERLRYTQHISPLVCLTKFKVVLKSL